MNETVIDVSTARHIASEWHGGQSSALYSFSRSGCILPSLQYEIEQLMQNTNLTYEDEVEVDMLLSFVKQFPVPETKVYRAFNGHVMEGYVRFIDTRYNNMVVTEQYSAWHHDSCKCETNGADMPDW